MTHKILFSLFLCGIIMPLNAQIKGTVIPSFKLTCLMIQDWRKAKHRNLFLWLPTEREMLLNIDIILQTNFVPTL